jgi:hypothetical protein
VVEDIAMFWKMDRFSGTYKAGWRFEKDHRFFGQFVGKFADMVGVVSADAKDSGKIFHRGLLTKEELSCKLNNAMEGRGRSENCNGIDTEKEIENFLDGTAR